MPVETPSLFAQVIQDHLELKRRNATLEPAMPLERYMNEAVKVSNDSPVLLDRFLNDAIEVDVDAVCDGKDVVIGGIMEHIEQAGVHSGDSACSLPPYSLPPALQDELRRQTALMARALGVVGLMNVQFAMKDGQIYVLEVNPRASRTVPFIAKAVGVPLVKIAVHVMTGKTLDELGFLAEPEVPGVFVKAPVFPFRRFPGVDPQWRAVKGTRSSPVGTYPALHYYFGRAHASMG